MASGWESPKTKKMKKNEQNRGFFYVFWIVKNLLRGGPGTTKDEKNENKMKKKERNTKKNEKNSRFFTILDFSKIG